MPLNLLDDKKASMNRRGIILYSKAFHFGWKGTEIVKMLCVTKSCMDYRKFRIRYKYRTYIGQY